jgi:hypothetical protein
MSPSTCESSFPIYHNTSPPTRAISLPIHHTISLATRALLLAQDKSGFLDKSEFATFAYHAGAGVQHLSAESVDKLFSDVARTKDSLINFDEFYAWYASDASKGGLEMGVAEALAIHTQMGLRVLTRQLSSTSEKVAVAKAASAVEQKARSNIDIQVCGFLSFVFCFGILCLCVLLLFSWCFIFVVECVPSFSLLARRGQRR